MNETEKDLLLTEKKMLINELKKIDEGRPTSVFFTHGVVPKHKITLTIDLDVYNDFKSRVKDPSSWLNTLLKKQGLGKSLDYWKKKEIVRRIANIDYELEKLEKEDKL